MLVLVSDGELPPWPSWNFWKFDIICDILSDRDVGSYLTYACCVIDFSVASKT